MSALEMESCGLILENLRKTLASEIKKKKQFDNQFLKLFQKA